MSEIQLVIVTPETTIFDQAVSSVILPLIDGEVGIYPNHAAMLGRLGPGELRAKVGGSEEKFYVDGGFVQVENNTVTVLPGVSMPSSDVVLSDAKAASRASQIRARRQRRFGRHQSQEHCTSTSQSSHRREVLTGTTGILPVTRYQHSLYV